jgi:hydrocephalus-inducing protein
VQKDGGTEEMGEGDERSGGMIEDGASSAAVKVDFRNSSLTVGPFTVSPSKGCVPPGGSSIVEVVFSALGNHLDKEFVYIGVNDLDRRSFGLQAQRVDGHGDAGGSISFELTGESCIPGIVSPQDLQTLFEEQEVVHTLVPATVRPMELMSTAEKDSHERALIALRQKRVFARSEKVFSFGCYVIDSGEEEKSSSATSLSSPSSSSSDEKKKDSRSHVDAAIPGTRERFRITNPCKVQCTVSFTLEGDDDAVQAFTVHPEKLDLPPHEHRFVSVYFKPMAMKEYRTTFVAGVELNGEQTEPTSLPASYAASRTLSFGLIGEGTLPSVVVYNDANDEVQGNSIDFGRLRMGRSVVKTPMLRNDGAVVATVRLDMDLGHGFSLQGNSGRESTLILYPRDVVPIPVVFNPPSVGSLATKLKISTLHNRFDKTTLDLCGESYMEDVTFEGLPNEAEDELQFDDQYFVGSTSPSPAVAVADPSSDDGGGALEDLEKDAEDGTAAAAAAAVAAATVDDGAAHDGAVIQFELRNTADDTVRFEWGDHPGFSFSPSIGHIAPREKKPVEATFRYSSVNGCVTYDKEEVWLTTHRIRLTAPVPGVPAWDTTMRAVTFGEEMAAEDVKEEDVEVMKEEENEREVDTAAAAILSASSTPEVMPARDDRAVTEPDYEAVEGAEPKQLKLLCTARVDWATFSCSAARSLAFRDTFMFQSRTHKIPVSNTSSTTLNYCWSMESSGAGAAAFAIEPLSGTIAPGATTEFVIRFAPMDADFYRCTASCAIPHLKSDCPPLVVDISGTGRRPICHFDLPRSAYLHRRPSSCTARSAVPALTESGGGPTTTAAQLTVSIDSSTRVIEMTSVGTHVRNTRRFAVTNPTSKAYEFEWDRLVFISSSSNAASTSPDDFGSSYFTNPFARGVMLPGRTTQMTFEYTPESVGNHESVWRFRLPQHNVSALFLLAGGVVEPRVRFDTSRIDFRQSLVGVHNAETVSIINEECVPFPFAFDREMLRATDAVTVTPTRGVVPPMGRTSIEVEFSPRMELHYNCNLTCKVQHNPLQLNIKGEGYAIHESVMLVMGVLEPEEVETISAADSRCVSLSSAGAAVLDFGRKFINSETSRTIVLCNTGKFHYDFDWTRIIHPMLQLEPMSGTVHPGPGNRVACRMTFAPTEADDSAVLDGIRMSCTVAGARRYVLSLSGRGTRAAVDFSFHRHDFGPCFIDDDHAFTDASSDSTTNSAVLSITNNEMDADVTLDAMFAPKPHLSVGFETTVLRPRETINVPIVFTPKEERRYEDELCFEVNGLYTVVVRVGGIGAASRVELTDPGAMSLVAFGALRVDQTLTKSVRIVNRGQRVSHFRLCEAPRRDGQSEMEFQRSGTLASLGVSWDPAFETALRPNESANVALTFAPTTRIPMINKGLFIRIDDGAASSLLTVTGVCEGIDVALETDHLAFGEVCEHSKLVRKLHLINSGDLPARYRWDLGALGDSFSIDPPEGIVMPSADATFDVTFHPRAIRPDIRCVPRCQIIGGDGRSSSRSDDIAEVATLSMTLIGSCISQPEPDVLEFSSAVCTEQKRSITIENPTDVPWHVRPSFEHDFWRGPDVIEVPPRRTAECEVIYRPLAMTVAAGDDESSAFELVEKHEGSLFIALPTGNALSYHLVGAATAPEVCSLPSDTVLSTPAKKALVISLPVRNLHKVVQRFDVHVKHDGSSLLQLRGATSIAVPPQGTRNFKLTFYSLAESSANAIVTLTSPTIGTYARYSFAVTATSPGVFGRFALKSNVRRTAKHVIRISNPLHTDVELPDDWWSCNSPDVRVLMLRHLKAEKDGTFDIEYRPLVATHSDGGDAVDDEVTTTIEGGITTKRLTLNCGPLGVFHYDLDLRADDPNVATETLRFKTSLGSTQLQNFQFSSFARDATSYTCTVDDGSFQVAPTVSAAGATSWSGVDVPVQVIYEPCEVRQDRAVLTVTDDVGGTYRCILTGECIPPQPRGPFTIAAGGTHELVFKNMFAEDMKFGVTTDSSFSVEWQEKIIPAKTEIKIVVKCSTSGSATGKMLISCPSASWVYYFARQ